MSHASQNPNMLVVFFPQFYSNHHPNTYHYAFLTKKWYTPLKKIKEKSCCLCACSLLFDPRYQRQDNWTRTIYNFRRILVEDFFLPVIKPPGTYFNNKLLPSCRSSKFSSSSPATSVLLCAPLDPIRPDRNSKSAWRQSVLIFLRQTLHWKLRRVATFLLIK